MTEKKIVKKEEEVKAKAVEVEEPVEKEVKTPKKQNTYIVAKRKEDDKWIYDGIKEYEGKGISYCAICDAAFYRDKDVAVLGNGEYAIGEIEELLPVAKSVTMLTDGKEYVENRSNNEKLKINGVVFTMYDGRTNLSNEVVASVKNNLNTKIYKTIIPRNVRLAEAPSHGLPINIYDPKSAGAESYRNLAKEIIENN